MRGALAQHTIHRNLLAGFHHHNFIHLDLLNRHPHQCPAAFDHRLGRTQRKQGLDRPPRPIHRMTLQHIGKAEQKQQQGPLEGSTNQGSPQSREHHQHIDIKHPLAQRRDRRPHPLLTRKHIGSHIQSM